MRARDLRGRLRGCDPEAGTMSLFFVMFSLIVLIMAGLVIDGGNAIAGRERAGDEAEQAARAGAGQIDVAGLRNASGTVLCPSIDQQAASNAIRDYAQQAGDTATSISFAAAKPGGPTNQVTVTIQTTTQLPLLAIIGIGQITTTGTATAAAEPGIDQQDGDCT